MSEFEIAITVYNKASYIKEVIEAALKVKNVAIIRIIDDCSTDNSYDILLKISSQNKRLRIHRNEQNQGVAFSRNKLIHLANSKYIAFIDGDDIVDPVNKSAQLSAVRDGNFLLSYSDYIRGGKLIRAKPFDKNQLLKGNYIPFSSIVVLREFLVENKLFFNKRHHEDYKFLFDISKLVSAQRVLYSQLPTFIYGRNGHGLSSNYVKNVVGTFKIIREQSSYFLACYYMAHYLLKGINKRFTKWF